MILDEGQILLMKLILISLPGEPYCKVSDFIINYLQNKCNRNGKYIQMTFLNDFSLLSLHVEIFNCFFIIIILSFLLLFLFYRSFTFLL